MPVVPNLNVDFDDGNDNDDDNNGNDNDDDKNHQTTKEL
jgi:hypothetical protein